MNEYMTVREASEHWNLSERWLQVLCQNQKIEGAIKFGRSWAIPREAEKPADSRVKSGKYKNWRKKR